MNVNGSSLWFDKPQQGKAHVFRHFIAGARDINIGCFQINYRLHSQAFKSIDEMFDPLINARHVARVLKQLYTQQGDWTKAVVAYQSEPPQFAQLNAQQNSAISQDFGTNKATKAPAISTGLTLVPETAADKRTAKSTSDSASLFATDFGG
ncbi:transglycosylase SLT domain-containing protein [Sulfitobacter noctilucae]|uniref:transglycosylase SLT domain-containing protein n=1 Tax=Sulfitobacter noctilucae TaxID=1342302 RepID=UPI001376D448|nr:transglycosylase SLT domain-containing protein [Sulfitobacter noctilucae]